MSVGDNRRYCECMGFYDGAGACLPYDPEIHEAEPCPPNQFWGVIFDWFSNNNQFLNDFLYQSTQIKNIWIPYGE